MTSLFNSAREYLTPVLKESRFRSQGVLTPSEFVAAGDQLVFKCPTWTWSGGDPTRRKDYLPPGKQFLITKQVPSLRRVDAMQTDRVDEVENEEGWTETSVSVVEQCTDAKCGTTEDQWVDAAAPPSPKAAAAAAPPPPAASASSDDEYADMADFEEDNLVEEADESTLCSHAAGLTLLDAGDDAGDNVLKTRTYDLSITYDKYYQTPRMWLFGYDEDRSPLSPDAIMQDIMQDYANKTVTIEQHPLLASGAPHASIHPCKHASVMKKIIDIVTDNGKAAVRPDQYLFIFLKFLQSVVPTIDYDFTAAFHVG